MAIELCVSRCPVYVLELKAGMPDVEALSQLLLDAGLGCFHVGPCLWLLWWLDFKLSVAVWVGMIAVAGLAVELGLLMMVYLDIAWRDRELERRLNTGGDLAEVIQSGAGQRIRPMLMTGLALFMGLVPILLSSGTGADVMQRIAAPMVGGVISALLMVLVVYPAIFMFWRGRGLPGGAPTPPRENGDDE